MNSEIIVAFGFISVIILVFIKFNQLNRTNDEKLTELTTHIIEWKSAIDKQQENFQSNVLNHVEQSEKILAQIWQETNEDLKLLIEKKQQGFQETLKSMEESQNKTHLDMLTTSQKVVTSIQTTWENTNDELKTWIDVENKSRNELLGKVSDVQNTNSELLQRQKEQIDTLQTSQKDLSVMLLSFIDETKQVSVDTGLYHQQMKEGFTNFTNSMHDLFDTKIKDQHTLLLNSEQVMKETLQAMLNESESNLKKYEDAIKEITTIQNSQSQLVLLMKKMQEEHQHKLEAHQEELREGLVEVFNDQLNTLNEKNREQNQEISITFEEIKDEIEGLVKSINESQKKSEITFEKFGSTILSLDDSLKQTVQVTKTMQTEMKSLGEKDIKLLEKMLR